MNVKIPVLFFCILTIVSGCDSTSMPNGNAPRTLTFHVKTPDGNEGYMPLENAVINIYHDTLVTALITDKQGECSVDLDTGWYLISPEGFNSSWPYPPQAFLVTISPSHASFDTTLYYDSPINAPNNLYNYRAFDVTIKNIPFSADGKSLFNYPTAWNGDLEKGRWRSSGAKNSYSITFSDNRSGMSGIAQPFHESAGGYFGFNSINGIAGSIELILYHNEVYGNGYKYDPPPHQSSEDFRCTIDSISIPAGTPIPLDIRLAGKGLKDKLTSAFWRQSYSSDSYSYTDTASYIGNISDSSHIVIHLY